MGLHDQWYKNMIVYCLDVETYADSNGDGVGDFPGLTSHLDYLAGLGVTCLWLMPFYPSPGGDDGYDVSDYCSIDPRFGDMADFAEFALEARERGMHVLVDLVPNHTSNAHPWFQKARREPESVYRDYYVWRTDSPGDTSDLVVFPGEQDGIWSYDRVAKAYYLHHFHDFQPDLNFGNARVREEFRRIIGLWLQMGADGLRVDAAPFLDAGQTDDDSMEAHQYLQELKDFTELRRGNAVLMGEVDVGLSRLADYFGSGNQLQALINFHLNRYLFLSLAQESADALEFGLRESPTIPGAGQWVNFLRHHDELNLSRLTDEQREQIYAAFGPEPEMQIYDRGLRRRLAPMLGGDLRRLKLAYSLMFSLPGAPLLFYGEEIGMGELLDLPGRLAVRTPMQWSSRPGGGFSSASPGDFVRPMVSDGPYGYDHVSVGDQRRRQDSLLNFITQLIRTRREAGEIGTGDSKVLATGSPSVLGLRYDTPGCSLLTFNNLSGSPVGVDIACLPDRSSDGITELLTDVSYEPIEARATDFPLAPYGFRWMRVGGAY